ncbi:MAG: hypothetical protein KAI35_04000 [Desulfobulbaceae bacterium]|nr:hypothetical protein [Desulfobulbaceae bacterium]
MKTREKIIAGLAFIALIYMVISLLFSSPENDTKELEKISQDLNQFATQAVMKAVGAQPSELDLYVTDMAEAEWMNNPFLKSESPVISEQVDNVTATSGETMEITYTGYLKTMEKKLAIINDFEYEEGEMLDRIGYLVLDITPGRVVIVDKKKKKNQIILPMEETYLLQLEKIK